MVNEPSKPWRELYHEADISPTFAIPPALSESSRHYLPLTPLALEQLDLSQYDLVISSESGPAKGGTVTPQDAAHLLLPHANALSIGRAP